MENGLKDRIKYLLREKNCTILELGGSENQRCKLSRQLNNYSAGITLSTVETILAKFPEVSAEWLLRGEGSMDKSDHLAPRIYASGGSIVQSGNNKGDATIDTPSQFELYGKDAVIMAKDDLITQLYAQVSELKHDKEMQQLLINTLTSNMHR